MYSLLSSAAHDIFFPPRLEVVALKQYPNCFPANPWNQFPFDRVLRYQTNGPASEAFGRLTADHGDDPLFLSGIQNLGRSGSLPFIERSVEPPSL